MHTNRQPVPNCPSFRTLAGLVSVCVLLFTSPMQAATPYPTAFDRIHGSIDTELERLQQQRRTIELGGDAADLQAMQAFMQELRATMVRVHEELLPAIRPELSRYLHSDGALARKAERGAGTEVEAELHIARMARTLSVMQTLAELQQWHLQRMDRERRP